MKGQDSADTGDLNEDEGKYTVTEALKDVTPIYGTYRSFNRFRDNPTFLNGADLFISGASDILLPFGLGAGIKSIRAANTARKLYKAGKAARAAKIQREGDLAAEIGTDALLQTGGQQTVRFMNHTRK